MAPLLVVVAGLPGVGKTTLARAVGARTGAVHVRIDTIESALTASGIVSAAGGWDNAPDAGYRVAYRLATDLLRAGHSVIADSVNPFQLTRRAWADVADDSGARSVNVEVVCTDIDVHRGRVGERTSDLDGLVVPSWAEVQRRQYEPWDGADLRVDTASGPDGPIRQILTAMSVG